jgi:hypothetical protein
MGNESLTGTPSRRSAQIEGEVTRGRVSELPKDQREWLTMKALNLTRAFPIMAGGSGWGTVGFNDCVEKACWQPLDVETSRDGGADWGRDRA